jgi:hypothetical protein
MNYFCCAFLRRKEMQEQELFFERLQSIKDYWVQISVESLENNADLIWSENEQEYVKLKDVLVEDDDKQAYKKILDETIKGAIHSILVMLDGGDELTDSFSIDLINTETKKSLKEGISLHEEFYSFLMDKE